MLHFSDLGGNNQNQKKIVPGALNFHLIKISKCRLNHPHFDGLAGYKNTYRRESHKKGMS